MNNQYPPPPAYGFAPPQIPGHAAPVGSPPPVQGPAPGWSPPPAAPGFQPAPMPGYAPPGQAPYYAPPPAYGAPPGTAPMAPPQGMPQGIPGMPPAGSLFSGMSGSKTFEHGSYFTVDQEGEGSYVCKIVKVLCKNTQRNGPAVIVEMEVVESSNPRVAVGVSRSFVQTLKDKNIAYPNIIAFLGAVYRLGTSEEINARIAPQSEQILTQAIEAGSLNGLAVRVSTFLHITKQNARITRLKFGPVA